MSAEIAVALGVSTLALVGTIITAYLSRRSAKESTAVTSWAELAAAHRAEIDRLTKRVDKIEDDLNQERRERQSLATVLRSAWAHILRLGEQVRSLGGSPEAPPTELSAWMEQDGLVVDRVETRITRTVVTDTRSPEAPLEVEE